MSYFHSHSYLEIQRVLTRRFARTRAVSVIISYIPFLFHIQLVIVTILLCGGILSFFFFYLILFLYTYYFIPFCHVSFFTFRFDVAGRKKILSRRITNILSLSLSHLPSSRYRLNNSIAFSATIKYYHPTYSRLMSRNLRFPPSFRGGSSRALSGE